VYTAGDPRVAPLLAALRSAGETEVLSLLAALEDEAAGRRGLGPVNADAALAALAEAFDMAPGAGEAALTIARMAGWWAHAKEESNHRSRFRPRAVYTGDRG
jgi:citrate synthase